MKLITLCLAAALSLNQSTPLIKSGTVTTNDLALAVARIPRFAPEKFAALPPSVRDALNLVACQVPQNTLTGVPGNVVSAELAARGQRDWAALCSNGTLTEMRIVWGGPERCEDRLAAMQDSDSISVPAPGVVVYTRTLTVASPEEITKYAVRLRAALPEDPIAHDGLRDGSDAGPVMRYCRAGHWQIVH
jgi:hypothetical protein